jgi:hypothetical protein
MAERELEQGEPFCAKCDHVSLGPRGLPVCCCGQTYEGRRAVGFTDAIGYVTIRWVSMDEFRDLYPMPTTPDDG